MPQWDFCLPLLSFTPLSVFSPFTRLDINGCPVAPGNQIWTTVNHFVWSDRPCWQLLFLLLDRFCVSLIPKHKVRMMRTSHLITKSLKLEYYGIYYYLQFKVTIRPTCQFQLRAAVMWSGLFGSHKAGSVLLLPSLWKDL